MKNQSLRIHFLNQTLTPLLFELCNVCKGLKLDKKKSRMSFEGTK